MPSQKTYEISKVLRKYSPRVARDYLDGANHRDRINAAAEKALLGIKDYHSEDKDAKG